jgi:hypothetical protein
MNKLAFLLSLVLPSATMADVAYIPPEILVDRAEIIVVGKVTRIDDTGAGQGQEFAIIDVKEVLKGDPKAKSVKLRQPALKGARLSHRITVAVGESGVFMLNKLANGDAYGFGHPSQIGITTEKTEKTVIEGYKKLIEARSKLAGGKEVNGLVARAEVIKEGGGSSIRFSLRNVSTKPIVICDYVGNRPLEVKWIGPDGKEIESQHYDWLKAARLRPVGPENFITIPAGGTHFISPHLGGADNAFRLDSIPAGENKIAISYTNKTNGEAFKIANVWTGTVTANEITIKK